MSTSQNPHRLFDDICHAVREYCAGAEQADDITLVEISFEDERVCDTPEQ